MPHIYDLNPHLKPGASKPEPKKEEPLKKRGRPKGSGKKK